MKHFIKFLFILAVVVIPASVFAAGSIISGSQYSQFLSLDLDNDDPADSGNPTNDFINWLPAETQNSAPVVVDDDVVTGMIWGESVGWINLGPFSQDAGPDAGVKNTCDGDLSGYAWGQNTGWINFSPTFGNDPIDPNDPHPKIDITTGAITGFVWSQNYGWIQLDSQDPTWSGLTTDWLGCSGSGGGGGGSSGGSSGGTMCQLPLVWNGSTCVNPQPPVQPVTPQPVTPTQPGVTPTTPGQTPTQPTNTGPGSQPNIPSTQPTVPGTMPSPLQPTTPLPIIPIDSPSRDQGSRLSLFNSDFINDIDIKAIGAGIGIIGLIGALLNLPFRIGNIILAIPALRRKRRYWGTVYDTATFEPLDPAYVQLFNAQGQEIASMITDMDGRYGFLVEPGTYTLKASKTNYAFPSRARQGQTSDRYYNNLYFGESITINQQGEVIAKDIPMDPTGTDWNQAEKRRMNTTRFFKRNDMFIHRIIDVLFVLGLVYSIYAVTVSPVLFNIIVIAIYAVVLLINLLGHPSRAYGIVKNKNGSPSAGSVVRIHNANLGREMLHRVVGKNGYYYALTQQGDYYATVGYPKPDQGEQVVHQTDSFRSSDGVISKKIKLNI